MTTDLLHHFSAQARPGPEEPCRPIFTSRLVRINIITGRADWLAGLTMDGSYALEHGAYGAGYEAEILDCLDAVQSLRCESMRLTGR